MKTILVDAVFCFVTDMVIDTELYRLLESYPNRKILLTGANDEQFAAWGLAAMPYPVFTLKHHPEKTDPEYYQLMLAHLGLTASDVVYFEHNPDAVASAQSVGIPTHFYDEHTKDYAALREFLNENLLRE
jgi:HAD superfamily hydrolase (TIGR01509 family)